jgi:simple sugar transport system permease protein
LILTALGMTLVIATGGVDLSVGAIAALSGAAATLTLAAGWPAALGTAIAAGLVVGLFNGVLITWLGLQPIIATLISMVSARGVAQLILGGQIVPLNNASYVSIGTSAFLGFPFAIWIALAIVLLMTLLLRKTSTGLFIEAVGANPIAARFIGLSGAKVCTLVYVVTGALAALSGVILSTNIRAIDGNNLGLYLELDAILAVVIGGTRLTGGRFSILGTILGALIIQTVTTTINTQGIRVELMLMVKAAVVIAICLAQSDRFRLPVLKGAN